MSGSALVTCQWLYDQFGNDRKWKRIQILDCSYYPDTPGRSAKEEFEKLHITGAYFFNVLLCTDKTSKLSNMLPAVGPFNDYVRYFGVAADIHVILYDGSETGLHTTPRVWFLFKALSHRRVSILDGGLKKWVESGFPTSDQPSESQKREYNAGQWKRRDSMVTSSNEMKEHVKKAAEVHKLNVEAKEKESAALIGMNEGDIDISTMVQPPTYQPNFVVIDTRPEEQFLGLAEHPKGYHVGHVAGSVNIRPDILIDPETESARKPNELKEIFETDYQIDMASDSKVIVTCNTGMNSPKVALALFLAGKMKISLFDGGFEDLTRTVDKKLLIIPKVVEPVEQEDFSISQIAAGNETEDEDEDSSEGSEAMTEKLIDE